MNNLTRLFITSLLTAASLASAQPTPPDGEQGPRPGGPGGPGGHGGPGGPHGPGRGFGRPPAGMVIVRTLDVDRNGELSAAEIANASAAILALDTNKDGMISPDELRPVRPADAPTPPAGAPGRPPGGPGRPEGAPGHPRPVDPVMLALDANGDGTLSAAEIANAPASLAALDTNKDGKLTFDELRPLPPKAE